MSATPEQMTEALGRWKTWPAVRAKGSEPGHKHPYWLNPQLEFADADLLANAYVDLMSRTQAVYLLMGGDGSDGNEWSVEGVFATRELAQAEIDGVPKEYRSNLSIAEWPVQTEELKRLTTAK